MKLAVVGHGFCEASEAASLTIPPAWRKATRNMIFSATAVQRAQTLSSGGPPSGVGALVFHSSSGDLDASYDFLVTWDQSRLARPVLFQNSLHNATAGFLAIHFGLNGPCVTLSGGSEEALPMAESLLQAGLCDYCWIVSCEVHKKMADLAELVLNEGAAAILVTTPERAPGGSRALIDFDVRRQPLAAEQLRTQPLVSFERDFLFRWSRSLAKAENAMRTLTVAGHDIRLAWN